jgi:hypothetical protein
MQMRRLWLFLIGIFFVGSAATLGVSYYSEHFVKEPLPLATFWDRGRSVAMGVYDRSDFTDLQVAIEPRFDFQVHSDLTWSIRFELGVLPASEKGSSAPLPKVVVLMPRDATDCHSGYVFNQINGHIQKRPNSDVSVISELPSTPENKVFEVAPRMKVVDDPTIAVPHVRYVLECNAKSMNTTRGGLGSTNFELDYLPEQVAKTAAIPGLGTLEGKLRITYAKAMRDDGSWEDVELNPDKLIPEHTAVGNNSYFWDYPVLLRDESVQGTANKEWISKISSWGNWFGGFLLGALAGLGFDVFKDKAKGKKED